MSHSSSEEGEIIETSSAKATTTHSSSNGLNVNRASRTQYLDSAPASNYGTSRSSASPGREGKRRRYEDEDSDSYSRRDPRHFKVHYEDNDKRRNDDRRSNFAPNNSRYSNKRPRTRSRSPDRRYGGHRSRGDVGRHQRYDSSDRRRGQGYGSGDKASFDHSVSNRTNVSVATGNSVHEAKSKHEDAPQETTIKSSRDLIESAENLSVDPVEPIDEAALIEQRRKRREAIVAKYKTPAAPLLVQALTHGNESEQSSPSAEHTPNGQDGTPDPPSPFADMANKETSSDPDLDGPSAADYDPTFDMKQDSFLDEKQHQDVQSREAAAGKAVQVGSDIVESGSSVEDAPKQFDMFAEDGDEDDDDMFADDSQKTKAKTVPDNKILKAKELDRSMLDNWDDPEGYYKVILGELIDGRYHVQTNLGKGMFSAVVRAIDNQTDKAVAIKLIRNNETMRKAGAKEIEILQTLYAADPDDKKHLIRLERTFDHKGHLCMVFENLSANLREVLKKFGRDVGINLRAIRSYAQQMFLGLSLLRKCNIIHADLKPDNILVNEARTGLKICDLGSACDATDNEITSYLVSRYYRAPELMLGMRYDFAIDMWSIGCTLFELYTGKILFTGRNNNQMLRAIMECRGKISSKMIRKGEYSPRHFDQMYNFLSTDRDKLTGRDVLRTMNFIKPTRDLKTRVLAASKHSITAGGQDDETKEVLAFADLLEKCLALNPEKRITPGDALRHPFLMRAK